MSDEEAKAEINISRSSSNQTQSCVPKSIKAIKDAQGERCGEDIDAVTRNAFVIIYVSARKCKRAKDTGEIWV